MPRSRPLLSVLLVAALAPFPEARADAGRTALDIHQGPKTAPPTNYFLFWNRVVAFGFAYNDSIFVALQSDRSADHRLFIPVVGPWLDLGQRDCGPGECPNEGLSKAQLIVDGASQDVGFVIMGASFFVRDQTVTIRMGDVDLGPVELARGAYGIKAAGRF